MVENIKARFKARRFNILTEEIEPRKKFTWRLDHWYANGKLYFGHPLFIFFLSVHNDWFKDGYPTEENQ